MADNVCADNRNELIAKYKNMLMESTNIEASPEEMAVINNILFRFWQMGWLDTLETILPSVKQVDCEVNNMDDYIKREDVINELNKLCDRVCQYSKAQRKVMCGACPLGDAFTVIEDEIPAADVRENVRGAWELDDDCDVYELWRCSVCSTGIFDHRYDFCPFCGADMRGEK